MKQAFKAIQMQEGTLRRIAQANQIIDEYRADGYDLTLRQLYYQFVARDIIANSQQEYKKLGTVINNGRLAGMIDWDAIKDRTRAMDQNSHWHGPENIIYACSTSYARDTREGQETYLEAWVEKEALAGVVERACREIDIPWFACRGYVSQTAMYEAAMRCKRQGSERVVILHLGDHDPSGMDMTRDNQDRMDMFGVECLIERIALNMDQVAKYGPPPNPAKLTDSRCGEYIAKYGNESWELDALEPRVLSRLIQDHAETWTDEDKRQALIERQADEKALLKAVSDRWYDVQDFLS